MRQPDNVNIGQSDGMIRNEVNLTFPGYETTALASGFLSPTASEVVYTTAISKALNAEYLADSSKLSRDALLALSVPEAVARDIISTSETWKGPSFDVYVLK